MLGIRTRTAELVATTGVDFSGRLSSGFIAGNSTFSTVFTFDPLLTRIRAATTYLNVHTRVNGPGEIRGQVSPWHGFEAESSRVVDR